MRTVRQRQAALQLLAINATKIRQLLSHHAQEGKEDGLGIENTPVPLNTTILHSLPRLIHELEEEVAGVVRVRRADKVVHECLQVRDIRFGASAVLHRVGR